MRREAKAPASGGALTVRGEVRGRGFAARYRLALLFGLLGLALLPLAPASPAAAALKYQQSGNFTNSFNFLINNSVAVNDHNGHIYVADSGSSNVEDFTSPSDTSPAIWEGSNTPHGFFGGHVSVAVDNSNGDVYVADGNHRAIVMFDENGNLITSFGDGTPGQLTGTATTAGSFSPNVNSYSSWGIAVDQANHDLYVLDGRNRVIDIFDQNGAYLSQITIPDSIVRQSGSYLTGLAVNNSGTVYVSDWSGPNQVYQFDSSGNYVRTLDGSNTPDGNFSGECTGCSLISVATENSTGKVFVGAMAHTNFDVFDSSGNFLAPQGFLPQYSYNSDIAVDQASGDVYVATYGSIMFFKPVIVPDAALGATSNSTATSITLSGHVDPAGGGDITNCYFEYVSNYSFDHPEPYYADPWSNAKQAPCTTNPASSLPYASATDVSADVTGLAPGTGYHLRLTVVNAKGDNSVTSGFASVGKYQLASDFGSAGSGDGQLNNPQDVAVDNSSGDIYVADTGNHRVVKLDSSGNFVSAWGWGVSDGNAAAQICTSGCQAGIAGSGAGQFTTPTFIEVDNSAGPSAGDVYVADTADNVVQKFDPEGNLITSWGTNGAKTYSGGIAGIGVDGNGVLIVQPGSGNGIALDSNGNVIAGTLAIDTSNNDRYYSDGTQIQQFTTASGCNPSNPYIPCPSVDTFAVGNLHSAAGLTIDPSSGVLYVANAGDNDIAVFAPLPLPTVTTATVENPGSTSVTVTGHVDPHGGGNVVDLPFRVRHGHHLRPRQRSLLAWHSPLGPDRRKCRTQRPHALHHLPLPAYRHRRQRLWPAQLQQRPYLHPGPIPHADHRRHLVLGRNFHDGHARRPDQPQPRSDHLHLPVRVRNRYELRLPDHRRRLDRVRRGRPCRQQRGIRPSARHHLPLPRRRGQSQRRRRRSRPDLHHARFPLRRWSDRVGRYRDHRHAQREHPPGLPAHHLPLRVRADRSLWIEHNGERFGRLG